MDYTNDDEELFPSSGYFRVSRLASILLPVGNTQGLEGGSYSFLLSFRAHLFNSVSILKYFLSCTKSFSVIACIIILSCQLKSQDHYQYKNRQLSQERDMSSGQQYLESSTSGLFLYHFSFSSSSNFIWARSPPLPLLLFLFSPSLNVAMITQLWRHFHLSLFFFFSLLPVNELSIPLVLINTFIIIFFSFVINGWQHLSSRTQMLYFYAVSYETF